jgi:hypothetical protein
VSTVASSARNANNKRPLSVVVPATSGSPTGPSKNNTGGDDKLQRDSRLGKYFDYDLSKMVNSKGGFLVEDDKEVDGDAKTKERERERQRAMQNLDPRTCSSLYLSISPALLAPLTCLGCHVAIYLDPSRNPKCHDCGSVDIDQMYRNIFRCIVCNKCRNEKVEKYGLLTKTECKEVNVIRLAHICDLKDSCLRQDYLLTDCESHICFRLHTVLTKYSRVEGRGTTTSYAQSQSAQVNVREHDALLPVPSRGIRLDEMGLARGAGRGMGETDGREEEKEEQEVRTGTSGATQTDSRRCLAKAEGCRA